MSNSKCTIGIDLHNLSASGDMILRTGIQQVVFQILKAQYESREKLGNMGIQVLPLPMLPYILEESKFTDLLPLHGNPTPFVFNATEQELNVSPENLWYNQASGMNERWSQADFYTATENLDWIFFTALSDFRFMVEKMKRKNPKLKVALLIYDLIPTLLPETASEGMRHWFNTCYLSSISHYVDKIFTISRHTAIDCTKFLFPLIGREIPVISSPIFSEVPIISDLDLQNEAIFENYGLKKKKYFICLGTIEPRKNLLSAIKGFLRYKELFPEDSADYKLVMIGSKGWGEAEREIASLPENIKNSLIMPGYLPSTQMEVILYFAKALLMPSRYEGYGMPIQFALNFELPVITSINSSLPESSNLQAYYVEPDNFDQIAISLRRISHTQVSSSHPDIHTVKNTISQQWLTLYESWVLNIANQKES